MNTLLFVNTTIVFSENLFLAIPININFLINTDMKLNSESPHYGNSYTWEQNKVNLYKEP